MSKPELFQLKKGKVNSSAFIRRLKDFLDLSFLGKLEKSARNKVNDVVFHTDKDFYNSAINGELHAGQIVKLKGFRLLEWIPASPGLFHTPQAASLRNEAKREYVRRTQFSSVSKNHVNSKIVIELPPAGKMGMVLGGFGSLRLAPKQVFGELQYIICGSSSGVSHEGIALFVGQPDYNKFISVIKDNEVPLVDITGRVMVLPHDFSAIRPLEYDQAVPRFYIQVEEINSLQRDETDSAVVSIAITYSKGLFLESNKYSYSFCSINPISDNKGLKEGVEWLKDYAKRYSGTDKPVIVGDFDEHFDHFKNVAFPLKEIANGKIPLEQLMYYKDLFNLTFIINENVFGDKNIISNSAVGAVGSSSVASNNNFFQSNTEFAGELDFDLLENELTQWVQFLKPTPGDFSQKDALASAKKALNAAKEKDTLSTLRHLLVAGEWAYQIARENRLTVIERIFTSYFKAGKKPNSLFAYLLSMIFKNTPPT